MDFSARIVAGLPWTAWLLCIAAVGLGLVIELVFFLGYFRSGQSGRKKARGD
jgi:hypothetical protein